MNELAYWNNVVNEYLALLKASEQDGENILPFDVFCKKHGYLNSPLLPELASRIAATIKEEEAVLKKYIRSKNKNYVDIHAQNNYAAGLKKASDILRELMAEVDLR